MKLARLILIQCVIAFILFEGLSRLIVQEKNGQHFILGKKWRYVLPFDYKSSELSKSKSEAYRVYDSLLGWSIGKSASEYIYFSNSHGYRCSKKEHESDFIEKRKYSYCAIGNSFTHGDAVAYEDTWVGLLSKQMNTDIANLGVGGYGIDQAVLRLMHSSIETDTVLFGLISGDLERATFPIYNFYVGGIKSKPMFKFNDKGYVLWNVPCLKPETILNERVTKGSKSADIFSLVPGGQAQLWLEHSWLKLSMAVRVVYSTFHKLNYQSKAPIYLSPESESYQYCLRIFEVFRSYCQKQRIYPIIVLIDEGNSIGQRIKAKSQISTWHSLKSDLENMDFQVLEFQDEALSLNNQGKLIHQEEKVHLSPSGNKLYADLIHQELRKSAL